MKTAPRTLLRLLLTGLIAALPLAATVAIFAWAWRLLVTWVGPQSAVGQGLIRLGFGAGESEKLGYLLGIGLVLLGLLALGLLTETGLQRGLQRAVEALVQRIPLVRNVYGLIQRFVGLLAQREGSGMASMSAVWCHFGGAERPGVAVLGLLSAPEAVLIAGRPHLAVLLPTAPVPVGGGLLYVPEDWVRPAEIGIDALSSLYVSMGVTSTEHLPRARPAQAEAAAAALVER
ncbi:DUF502 domain-containing protein [Aquariibacter lacus]|uniref:DUF502 domain-containing protein n=1 Tax=Aquariibacter lacus TaxID=2801332 RepID=UPI003306AEE2